MNFFADVLSQNLFWFYAVYIDVSLHTCISTYFSTCMYSWAGANFNSINLKVLQPNYLAIHMESFTTLLLVISL